MQISLFLKKKNRRNVPTIFGGLGEIFLKEASSSTEVGSLIVSTRLDAVIFEYTKKPVVSVSTGRGR